jgi:hypothetical protein
MLARVRDRLTYANVVSTICLFAILGGSAYAAITLPPKSVGTKQLKNKAVKRKKIAPNAVNGAKVANDKLTGLDVNESKLGRVPEAQHANLATNSATLDGHTFDYFEAAQRAEFGSANRTSTTRDRILEWPNAHAQVVTDGDADAGSEVLVRNTSATGGGDLQVIQDDTITVVSPGNYSPQITGSKGDLHFVVARADGRTIWVRCAFPDGTGQPVRCLGERSGPN